MWGNDSHSVYDPQENILSDGSTNAIRDDVIDGAAFFLKGYSDILLFLNKIELSEKQDLDYAELRPILDRAIGNMELVKTTYMDLIQKARSTPYNPGMIEKLKNFRFSSFWREKGLNPLIFRSVQSYLASGDVRGLHSKMLANIEGILDMLSGIKERIDVNVFPGISGLWKLNHSCSDILLFGQYVAMIFGDLLGRI
jgi:hypothetical protein